jgi:hypothetical protein
LHDVEPLPQSFHRDRHSGGIGRLCAGQSARVGRLYSRPPPPQVELGISCEIGGATSSAALSAWDGQK